MTLPSPFSPRSYQQSTLADSVTRARRGLEEEISRLGKEFEAQQQAYLKSKSDSDARGEELQRLQGEYENLQRKADLRHLLDRVRPEAQAKLLASPEFQTEFEKCNPQDAFIMSIDIRRSTELMLKAREPRLFAEFITDLADSLKEAITESYGVYDKFTGDGILAFFPSFYSGADAGYFALDVASQCHRIFNEHYKKSHHCFNSVLLRTGLGIGVDFGSVQVVRVGDALTVVGTPVVYACRMGGAVAGETYVNQPAYERLFERYPAHFHFTSTTIDLKHEGETLAYSVKPNGKRFEPQPPPWVETVKADKAAAEPVTSATPK